MKETLIKLLKRINVQDACSELDGKCNGINCPDCPFWSETTLTQLIAELEAE